MSGQAWVTAPRGPRAPDREPRQADLFTGLVVSNPVKRKGWFGFVESLVAHSALIAGLVLVPILWPAPSPEHPDYIRALIYNPPPPPPPPLPKGQALIEKPQPAKPVTPEIPQKKPEMTLPVETLPKHPQEAKPEDRASADEQVGSLSGSDLGMPEGMEIGVEGGVPGGVPGGQLGGVIGGTGDGPVLDYDQAPRLIKKTQPVYPQEAFVKKIDGVVLLEILIDASGRVARARIIQSVPLLDQAAVDTVKQWVFAPAVKRGRPVATIALVPVDFRIY